MCLSEKNHRKVDNTCQRTIYQYKQIAAQGRRVIIIKHGSPVLFQANF